MPLLAEAYSEARLDLSKLDRDIKTATAKLERAAKQFERKLKLKAALDVTPVTNKLKTVEKNADRVKTKLRYKASVDTTSVNAKLKTVAKNVDELQRKIGQTSRLDIDVSSVADDAARAAAEIEALPDEVTVNAEVDLDGVTAFFAQAAAATAALEAIPDVSPDIELDGLGQFLAGALAATAAAEAIPNRVRVEVDIDRDRGFSGIARGIQRAFAGFSGIARGIQRAFASVAGTVANGIAGVAADAANQVSKIASDLGSKLGSGIAGAAQLALQATLFAALGVIIAGAVSALAGGIIAGITALIGGLVATLATGALVAFGAAFLPGLAIILGPAKDQIARQLAPLKDQLLEVFAPTTELIVGRLVPAFTAVASQLLPIIAGVANSFITPIADSLFRLANNPALADAFRRFAAPLGEGLASIIDQFNRIVPLFSEITAAVGPPIAEAINAILEAVAVVAFAFRDDLGGAIQVVADLFTGLGPKLASLGPVIEPVAEFIAGIIDLLVDVALQIEARFGPIGGYFDEITASLDNLQPGLVAFGEVFVFILDYLPQIINGFSAFAGAVTASIAVFAGFAYVVVNGVTLAIKVIGGAIDLVLAGVARVADGIARFAGFIGDQESQEELEGFADSLDGIREGVREAGNAGFAFGDSLYALANAAGNATDTAFGLNDATDAAARSTRGAIEANERMAASYEAGNITIDQYLAGQQALIDNTGIFAEAFPAATKVIEKFRKELEEGGKSLSEFANSVQTEIPKASEFITNAFSGEDQRAIADRLNEQARRDAADLQIAQREYSDAQAEFDRIKARANPARPDVYLDRQEFTEAQRRVEELRRRVTDAQRAAADSAAEAATGGVEPIQRQTIDIVAAIDEAARQTVAAGERARTLIRLRARTDGDFNPIADFLADLPPDLFVAAIDQLGGVTSEAFRRQNEKLKKAAQGANETLADAFRQQRQLYADQAFQLRTLIALEAFGFGPLAEALAGFDPAAFRREYEALASRGLEGIQIANAAAAFNAADQQLLLELVAEAQRLGITLGAEAAQVALEAAQAEWDAKFGPGGVWEEFTRRGVAPARPTSGATPQTTGAEQGEGVIAGIEQGIAGGSDRVAAAVSGLYTGLDVTSAEQAGAALGQGILVGLKEALTGNTFGENQQAIFNAMSTIAGTALFSTPLFVATGAVLGGAVITGVAQGFNEDGGTIVVAVQLLAESAVTAPNLLSWSRAGRRLGRTMVDAARLAINGQQRAIQDQVDRMARRVDPAQWRVLGRRLVGAVAFAMVVEFVRIDSRIARALTGVAETVADEVDGWFALGVQLGRQVVTGAVLAVVAATGDLSAALDTLVQRAVDGPADAAAFGGLAIGAAIGQGIVVGLFLATPTVVAAAEQLAAAVTAIIKAAFVINSPSQVMIGIGQDVARGLAVGLDSVDLVEGAAQDTATAAIEGVQAAVTAASFDAQQPFRLAGEALGVALGEGIRAGLGNAFGVALDALDVPTATLPTVAVRPTAQPVVAPSLIGTGISRPAALTTPTAPPVQSTGPVYSDVNQSSSTETTVFNLYGTDPRETAAEVALKMRSQRYLLNRERLR